VVANDDILLQTTHHLPQQEASRVLHTSKKKDNTPYEAEEDTALLSIPHEEEVLEDKEHEWVSK